MSVVLDTNILLRLVDRRAPEHGSVRSAVDSLIRNGEELCVVPQVLVEFYVAATRPIEVNGFGWDPPFTLEAIEGLMSEMTVLPDHPDALSRWLEVVKNSGIRGLRAHDARIAALMLEHGVDRILTLNVQDFAGISGLTTIAPTELAN